MSHRNATSLIVLFSIVTQVFSITPVQVVEKPVLDAWNTATDKADLSGNILSITGYSDFASSQEALNATDKQGNSIRSRAVRYLGEGKVEGEMGIHHMNNTRGVRWAIVFIGYGGNGANGWKIVDDLKKAGYNVIVVFMPRGSGTRGSFGKLGAGQDIDYAYEDIEKFFILKWPEGPTTKYIKIVDDDNDLPEFDALTKPRDPLEKEAANVGDGTTDAAKQWAAMETLLNRKYTELTKYITGQDKACVVIDAYTADGYDNKYVAIPIRLYTQFLAKARQNQVLVGCAELPAGFGKNGFETQWAESSIKNIPATNFVADFFMLPNLKKVFVEAINKRQFVPSGPSDPFKPTTFAILYPQEDLGTIFGLLKVAHTGGSLQYATPEVSIVSSGLTYKMVTVTPV